MALLRLAEAIAQYGVQPQVLLFSDGPLFQKLQQSQIPVHLFPLSAQMANLRKESAGIGALLKPGQLQHSLAFIVRLARFLRQQPLFDIVHTNSLKADLLGGFAARLAHIPLVWHIRDRIETDYLPPSTVRFLRRMARLLPQGVVANSHATLQTLHLPPSKPAAVVYSGIPNDWVEPPYPPAPFERAGNVRIGLLGRIAHWKGHHVFLTAAAQVCPKFPNTCFEIIGSAMFGDQPYLEELKALVEHLGLTERVCFRGFQENTREVVANLDILAHTSIIPEPLGQVVLEGMALGRGVVATAGGGVLEVMVPQETGLLVPMGDEKKLAEAILHLLENPLEARAMGERARERVRARFTVSQTAANAAKLYQQLLR